MKAWLSANSSFLRELLATIDTPVSLAVWLQIENKEWDDLSLRWVDPLAYPEGVFSALRYRADVQAVDLLRKAPLPTTFSRRDAALAAWESAEDACYHTNEFIARLSSVRVSPAERHFSEFLGSVQKRMGRWLGAVPPDIIGGFGPGTCVEYDGANPTVVDKIWLTPTTTPDASLYFQTMYARTLWGRERIRNRLPFHGVSRGNRLTTVPKDGKTDRPISIEPLGNLWLQLGVGRYLKKRLHHIGLPRFSDASQEIFPGLVRQFSDAQAIHRDLARDGWKTGLATIDLSSASDTVSSELVRRLLPADWFTILDDFRSKKTWVPSQGGTGSWRHLEKFSSMGNGFTFELETFIFLALLCEAFGLTPGIDCWVFGDDIIIPEGFFDDASRLLELCGFSVNQRKSYRSGPFRESCGGNFHSGIDTTPVRIKGPIDEVPAMFSLHNALVRRGFHSAARHVRQKIPRALRFFGPERLGDVVLHGRFHSVRRKRFSPDISWVKTLAMIPTAPIPLERWSPELAVVALLLGSGDKVVRRNGGVSPTSVWASVS